MKRWRLFVVGLVCLSLLAACGGGGTPAGNSGTSGQPEAQETEQQTGGSESAADDKAGTDDENGAEENAGTEDDAGAEEDTGSTDGITLVDAVLTKELGENQEPLEPTEDFYPDETINVSLEFEGRPREGLVSATFYYRDQAIADAEVDFADANSGVIFSIGESTFAGFNLTHDDPFPLSSEYSVETFVNGEPLTTVPFAVVPPEDAIPSEIGEVVLAEGADDNQEPINPTETFAADQEVYLVGSGSFGIATWIQADWYVNGELDEQGTRSLTLEENIEDTGFFFSFVPDGGWPEGEHEVVLTMNDEEVGTYPFTVE